MEKRIKIAVVILFLFGLMELMGLLLLLIPQDFLPEIFEGQALFWALLSGIYGLARIVAAIGLRSKKKWAWMFAVLLCLTTLIVAPTIIPFGVIDLILALVILVCLLQARYGDMKLG